MRGVPFLFFFFGGGDPKETKHRYRGGGREGQGPDILGGLCAALEEALRLNPQRMARFFFGKLQVEQGSVAGNAKKNGFPPSPPPKKKKRHRSKRFPLKHHEDTMKGFTGSDALNHPVFGISIWRSNLLPQGASSGPGVQQPLAEVRPGDLQIKRFVGCCLQLVNACVKIENPRKKKGRCPFGVP